ncbi:MAG: putative DNA binding domain-containing protein [Pirellulaceae bacterium]
MSSYQFLGPDPLDRQIEALLSKLAAGDPPDGNEGRQVDVKEEPGRRGPGGTILAGREKNEAAANFLAEEMACFANSPGGGAIILGVADDGTKIGTSLDAEWLRHRIYQLTNQKLTVEIRPVRLGEHRLLVLRTHQAVETVYYNGRARWRVDDNCVPVDPTVWHAEMRRRTGYDWSAETSGHSLADADEAAIEAARKYLRAAAVAGDEAAASLADASDADLLRRLNVADGEGALTNAGALLFVGTPAVGFDYVRRNTQGGDSVARVRSDGPLLNQIVEVESAVERANRIIHMPTGFAHSQLRAVPVRALREAIINGGIHRDWLSAQPTTIEHVGDMITVTSPGGFIGGITPENIITHPAVPRYRSLAEAVASLRLAEREGIGVDRMVIDMLSRGHRDPEIREVPGPYVRVSLVGGSPDPEMIRLLASVSPTALSHDVDALLLIDHLSRVGWVDADRAAPVLQRPQTEAEAALVRLRKAAIDQETPIIVAVEGTPADSNPAFRLSDAAQAILASRTAPLKTQEGRKTVIRHWTRARKRISSSEAADLTGISAPYAATDVLPELEEEGFLRPVRPNRRGRGFHYLLNRPNETSG